MNLASDRAKDLFLEALALDAADRPAFLGRACGADGGLRADVAGLLAHHAALGSFLASGPADPEATVALPAPAGEAPGAVVGPYKLLEQIGEGGFGVVYMAEQAHPVRRRVALKVLKPGMDTKQVVARFEAERQALALMDHPNIAKVFDGGETPAGRPYFAMDLVKGVPITAYCDQQRLAPRARLELFLQVCRAIQHAHTKGIIHRDVKPSNVLVTVHDTTPVVKVIDFGVAKALGQELTDKTLFTGFAQMVGTPLYMSPEQAGQSGLDVDTRSDIYSLGVLLYELLTGMTPFDKDRFRAAGYDEMRRIIREEEPPRPSTRLSTLGAAAETLSTNRGSEPRRLSRLLRGELDWVVMTCLEKDRTRRYETAAALAADVERYLADEPVQACPPSAAYRVKKFVRRNKAAMVVAAATVLAGVTAVASLAGAVAVLKASHAEITDTLGREKDANEQLSEALGREQLTSHFHRIARADAERSANNVGRAQQHLDECPARLRNWEWHYLNRLCHAELFAFRGHTAFVYAVAFSPDGRHLASGSHDKTVRVWDIETGRAVFTLEHADWVNRLAYSPDGRFLATATGVWSEEKPGEVKVWDAATGKEVFTYRGHGCAVTALTFGRGNLIASGSMDGVVTVWDAATGGERLRLRHGPRQCVKSAAFSPDGRRLAVGSWGETENLKVLDAATGEELLALIGHTGDVIGLDFSPDGNSLASSGWDQTVRVWNVPADRRGSVTSSRLTLAGHSEVVYTVAFSPDGRRLASSSSDGSVLVRDAETGRLEFTLRGHTSSVPGLAFSPGGRHLATGSWDHTVKVWDVTADPQVRSFLLDEKPVWCAAYTSDGRHLAVAEWHPATTSQAHVWVLDADTGRRCFRIDHAAGFTCVAFSRDDRLLATDYDREVRVWDGQTGKLRFVCPGHEGRVTGVAFHPDGRRLASASKDRTVKVWDLAAGRESCPALLTLTGHVGPVTGVAFRRGGAELASASEDGTVKVWDAATGRELRTLRGHGGPVRCVAYDPDGLTLASAGDDGIVKVWDAATGRELRTLGPHAGPVGCVAFSPDGRRLATGTREGSVTVWDPASGHEALAIRRPFLNVNTVTFSPDGRRLVAGGYTGTPAKLKLWDATEPGPDGPDADPDGWRAKVLAWHAREAEGFEARRQWKSSLAHRGRQIELKPDDPSRWATRGWTHRLAGEWDKAIADYSRALELKPTEATAWGTRAWLREQLGQWEQARDDYTAGIERKADYWEAWVGRGRCHGQLGRYEQAVADFAETVRLQPNDLYHRHQLAVAHLASGDEPGYRRVCRDMLGRFGKTTSPGVASRVLYACLTLPDVAADPHRLVALGELAVQDFKGNERVLGAALYRGRHDQALAAFTRSADKGYRRRAWDWCFLAMCHHQLGHADEARDCLANAACWAEEADRLQTERSRPGPNTWTLWSERVEVEHLRREAEALLDGMSK